MEAPAPRSRATRQAYAGRKRLHDGDRETALDTVGGMPGVAEAELLARLRAGDEAAFATVLDRWSDGMLWLARDFVSTNESAAEVVQDT